MICRGFSVKNDTNFHKIMMLFKALASKKFFDELILAFESSWKMRIRLYTGYTSFLCTLRFRTNPNSQAH